MRNLFAVVAITVVVVSVPPRAAAPNWHITATVAESCSCTISCPCNFGGEPTKNPCEGNRLIAIKAGHYEDVDLGFAIRQRGQHVLYEPRARVIHHEAGMSDIGFRTFVAARNLRHGARRGLHARDIDVRREVFVAGQ